MAVKSIGKSSFWGIVLVSWLSILLLGGAWIGVMYYDFLEDARLMRENHFRTTKELVRTEVEKGIALVQRLRKAKVEELWQDLHLRAENALLEMEVLTAGSHFHLPVEAATRVVLDVIAFENKRHNGLYGVRDGTLLMLTPFPRQQDMEGSLSRIADELQGYSLGEHQVGLKVGDDETCTLLFVVIQGNGPFDRIISGACLESVDVDIKKDVVDRLESIRFGNDGYIFGATWDGVSVVGPVKGRNMWNTMDGNGVYVVQELVAAARRGGGFVEYVMPPVDGRRETAKVSYAMPIRDWEWYLGAGQYIDDIEYTILQNKNELGRQVFYRAWFVVICLGLLSVGAFFMSRRLSFKMEESVSSFTDVWKRASTYGATVDPQALQYKEFRDLADAANRMLEARRVVEEQLRESNEQFRMLAENIPGVILQCDVGDDRPVRYISDAVQSVAGYPAADFISNRVRGFDSIIDPRDRAWVQDTIEKSVESGTPYSLEYRIDRKDGRNFWVFEKGQARYDENGNAVSLEGVVFDVTDRKLAEDEHYQRIHYLETLDRIDKCIHDSDSHDDLLSDVMEAIRLAFHADRSWLLTPCDPEARFFSIPIERASVDYPGAKARGIEIPVDAESAEVFKTALRENKPVAYDPESGLAIPSGISKYFKVQSQLVMAIYPHEEEPWLIGMHQCASPRIWTTEEKILFKEVSRRVADALSTKLVLEKLGNSEERFRTFSEQTMLGLCALQGDAVVFANQAYCDIFEMNIEDVRAMTVEDLLQLVHPDDRAMLMEEAFAARGRADGSVSTSRWRAITRTGRLRWVQHYARSITLNGRRAELLSLTDVTDMQRSNEELEQLIQERTSVLAAQAEELEAANKRLLRLDELKSSFVTTVSHDLRTPLTSVLGYAKLVRKDLNQSLNTDECGGDSNKVINRIVNNLGIMESEGKRLSQLVDEFMDLTSMEAGTASWYDSETDVEELLRQLVKQARLRVERKPGLVVALDIQGTLPLLMVDPIRLKQVLSHLVDNAIQYSESGMIRLFARSTNEASLHLTVSDEGKGIPESELEAIFEPFHQVETGDTLVDEIKGSGLGLSLSRGIIQHYGGTISAESILGRGSVFDVVLPGSLKV